MIGWRNEIMKVWMDDHTSIARTKNWNYRKFIDILLDIQGGMGSEHFKEYYQGWPILPGSRGPRKDKGRKEIEEELDDIINLD